MVTVKKGKKNNPHFSLLKLQHKFVVFKPISKEEMQEKHFRPFSKLSNLYNNDLWENYLFYVKCLYFNMNLRGRSTKWWNVFASCAPQISAAWWFWSSHAQKHHTKKGSEVIAWLCRPHTYRRTRAHTQQSLCTMCCHIFKTEVDWSLL